MAALSWTPKGIVVGREVDKRDNGQRQHAQGKGTIYLNRQKDTKTSKHWKEENATELH